MANTGKQVDQVEKAKRIRIIMEWILEDHASTDILDSIVKKWKMSYRNAQRYLAEAREAWLVEETDQLDNLRKIKIQSLKRLKKTMRSEYLGTPIGIKAILAVEKEIITLEGIRPASELKVKVEREGDGIDYSKLSEKTLMEIIKARKTDADKPEKDTDD